MNPKFRRTRAKEEIQRAQQPPQCTDKRKTTQFFQYKTQSKQERGEEKKTMIRNYRLGYKIKGAQTSGSTRKYILLNRLGIIIIHKFVISQPKNSQ